ncbi:MAG: VCBS domain-containing protein, partial [Sphingomonadaceae bacterium]
TPDANWNGTVPTVTYTVSDNEGGTDTANLDITVNPVVDLTAADDSNTTDEDTPVSGSVAGNDNTTSGGTLTFAKDSDPANGTVTINPDGTYTYTPNPDFHGEDSFNYTVTDADSGESLTQTVTITVNPVNDAPEIVEADQSGNVTEAGNLDDGSPVAGQPTSSGSYSATDVENDTLTWSVLGTLNGATIDPADTNYGSFSINPSTGAWSYALDDALPSTQALNEVDTVDLIYVIEADDGNGGTDTRNVTITINGTNDAPVAMADTATAVESGVLDGGNTPTSGIGSASGNVLANDSDVDDGETAALTVNALSFGASDGTLGASLEGTYGSLVLNANGSYTYTLDNSLASTQALQQGETADEVFSYTTQDVNGAVSTSTLTVSITGTNDRPTITSTAADAQGSVTEVGTNETGVATANGQLTASDVDTAATQTWTVLSTNGTYGTIGIDAMTGEWTYTLDDTRPATQALNDGDSETETFTARVTDEHGAFRDQTITITVNGSNDEFMGSGNVNVNLDEDGNATGTLQDYVDDVDDTIEITGFTVDANGDGSDENYTPGTPITVQDSDGNTLGTLNIATDGDYSFVPVANYAGDVPTVTYTAAETGGGGVTVTQTIDFSITKISDVPGMEASKTVNTAEDTAVALGLVAPVVADTGTGTANNDNSERLGAISLTITGSGASGVTLANGAETLNFVGGEITIVLTDGNHVDSVPAETPASGIYHMTTAEYEALLATPSAESGQDFTITVSATSYEVDSAGTIIPTVAGASNTQTVDIDVQAITDGASLTIDGGPSATLSGDEDTAIDIAGHLATALGDTDANPGTDSDGSETYWYSVTGLPVGTEVNFGGTTTTVTSTSQVISSAPSTSPAAPIFTITPPGDFSGDIDNVTVTLNSQDTDGDSAGSIATLTSSVTLDLRVDPVAGDVRRSNSSTQEDQAVDFLSGVRVVDNGTGNEVIDSVGFTAPAGWTVTEPTAMAGWTNTGTGSDYLIEFDSGLTEAQREAILDAFLITPAPHSSANEAIALTITSTDTNTVGGVPVSDTATVTQNASVTVTPVAERTDSDSDGDGDNDVTMTAGHTYSTSGQEDAWFDLNVEPAFDLSAGWSNEDSDEELFAVLTPSLTSSTPGDTVIGTQFRYSTDGGSTFTIETYGGSPVWVSVDYLDTLEVKLPADVSGTLTIGVEAGTIDTDPDNGATAQAVSGSATLAFIEIDPVADAVTMALNGRAVGLEDTAIPLDIEVVSTDTSETFNVTINGIPNGASITYDGSVLTVTAGSVTITDFDNSAPISITPPADSNVDFSLNVSAVSVDGSDTSAPVSRTISVAVSGVADTPSVTLATPDFVTTEAALDSGGNNRVALSDIVTGIVPSDADGSETATLRITGLDAAFSITGATSVVSGTGTERVWVTSIANLGDVSVILPQNYSGTVDIQFAGVATENDGDSLTAAPVDASFTVTPSPEATITDSTTLIEDQITLLNFAIVHQNGDADETLGEIYVPVSYDDSDYTLFVGGSAIDAAGLATTTIGTTSYYVIPTAQVGNLGALTTQDLDGPLASLDFQYQIIDPSSDGTLLEQASVNPATMNFVATPVTDAVDASITAITLTSATGTTSNATPSGDDADPDTASITGSGSLAVNMHVDSADVDGSEHLVRILISGVPEGVTVTGADQLGTGSWLLVYEAGAALSLGSGGVDVPVEFVVGTGSSSGTSVITMTALAQDRGNLPDSEASIESDSVSWNLDVSFSGGGGPLPPTILDWTYNGTPGSEDTAFVLGDVIDAAVSTSNPAAAYSYTVTLRDLPEDSIVTGMTQSSIGGETIFTATVTVAPGGDSQVALDALMAGITVTAPENENDNNSDFGFTATLAAAAVGGITADADTTADMPITPVSDDAEITVTANETDEGTASTTATITAGTPIDGAYGQIVGGNLYVQVSDTNNPGGTVSDSGGILSPTAISGVAGVPDGTYYIVNVGTAGGSVDLTYTAPSGSVLEPGDVTFTAWAQTQETGASNIAAVSGTGTADIIIVNNGVTAQSDPVTGNEAATTDNTEAIELSGLMVGLVDDDGSESIQSILLAGLPVGFQILVGNSAGDATVASQASNAGGNGTTNTWIVSAGGTMPAYVAVLPAANWSGSLTDLQLLVESAEDTFSHTRVDAFALAPLTIEAVANGIEIDPTLSFGTEGSIIDVNLNASMSDAVISPVPGDDSVETTTLLITGLGEYAAFYVDTTLVTTQSYDSASDTYTITGLSQEDLDDLGFVQAASALTDQDGGTSGTQIAVSVHTVESGNGDMSASDTGMLTVSLAPVLATSFDDNFILGEAAINGGDGDDNVDFRVGESLSNAELAALLDEIESIDLSADGPNGIFGGLSGLDVEDITGSGTGTLTIDGDVDDTVELSSAAEWTTDGIPSGGYLTYANAMSGVTLMIDEVIAVSYDL